MYAYGYDIEDEDYEQALRLSQATLLCNVEDIDKIIDFLQYVKKDLQNKGKENCGHWHYRDHNDAWIDDESDFIIYLMDEEEYD